MFDNPAFMFDDQLSDLFSIIFVLDFLFLSNLSDIKDLVFEKVGLLHFDPVA